ncbi:MAG: hypothetical protein ACFFB3_01745 [Candidatus Hodarchaeota archaeon]
MHVEEFPYKSAYDDLVQGKTISKRGQWWTALLLVEPKKSAENAPSKRKIIIQRWKKQINRETGESFWRATKNFTLTSTNVWSSLRDTIDNWITEKEWK